MQPEMDECVRVNTKEQVGEVKEGLIGSLQRCVLHKKRILAATKEISWSHDFETNKCFVSAGDEYLQEPKSWIEIKEA